MKAWFDADMIVYRACFAAEKMEYRIVHKDQYAEEVSWRFPSKKDFDAYVKSKKLLPGYYEMTSQRILEPFSHAVHNARSIIDRSIAATGADEYTLVLSGSTNFRNDVATIKPYKGNRDPSAKPQHGPAMKEWMRQNYSTITSMQEEADDVVAYNHYGMWEEDEYSSCIVTYDKDLDMIPGLHFNFVTESAYVVDEAAAMRFFYTQLITGDQTDNIPGVPGYGKVKAKRALADVPDDEEKLYEAVRALYVQGYSEDEDAALLENARLLWIRREPKQLWEPPV